MQRELNNEKLYCVTVTVVYQNDILMKDETESAWGTHGGL